MHAPAPLSLGFQVDDPDWGSYQHDDKERKILKRSGLSVQNKVRALGQKCHTLSVTIYGNPMDRKWDCAAHIPDGFVIPNLNHILHNYIHQADAAQDRLWYPADVGTGDGGDQPEEQRPAVSDRSETTKDSIRQNQTPSGRPRRNIRISSTGGTSRGAQSGSLEDDHHHPPPQGHVSSNNHYVCLDGIASHVSETQDAVSDHGIERNPVRLPPMCLGGSNASHIVGEQDSATAKEAGNCNAHMIMPDAPSSPERQQDSNRSNGSTSNSMLHGGAEHVGMPGPEADLLPSTDACPTPPVADAIGLGLMKDVLLRCAELNYASGKPDLSNKTVCTSADVEKVRRTAHEIANSSYSDAMYNVRKNHSFLSGMGNQVHYNETIYWEIIKKAEKLLDPSTLSSQKGRTDEFTIAEKAAVRRFIVDAGYGISTANQQRRRRLWKRLYDLRQAGVDKILLYRTTRLDNFFIDFPMDAERTLVDTVLSWEAAYGPQIAQLEYRLKRASQGDKAGLSWLETPSIAERLDVPYPDTLWNCANNPWLSAQEEVDFKSTEGSLRASEDELGVCLLDMSRNCRNKSIFVNLVPNGRGLLSVVPIMAIDQNDYLGIFGGHLRYSDDFDATHGIRGPRRGLWLDYSQVIGVLNQMRVSRSHGDANVRLVWKLCEPSQCAEPEWRVSVRALRTIGPFEEMVRFTDQEAQFLRHRDPVYARRGYLR